MTTVRARKPRGSAGATGGQFAAGASPEAAVALTASDDPADDATNRPTAPPARPGADLYGFPVLPCTSCDGQATNETGPLDDTDCQACAGTGVHYSPEVLAEAVADFAQAQRDAARPKVHQLRTSDLISKPYRTQAQARFRTVAKVLVAPTRPVRYEGTGDGRRPVAYVAAVEYTDGSRDLVTTDTVYARRGNRVNPTPYARRVTPGAVPAKRGPKPT